MKESNFKNMFGRAAFIFCIFFITTTCSAQKLPAPNSIYLELLGNGIIYSINYDRMFNENVGGRIGFTYFPAVSAIFTSTKDIFVIPVMLNTFVGTGDSKLELGAGFVYAQATLSTIFSDQEEDASGMAGTITIGYRYQERTGGLLFRIGFTPFFKFNGEFMLYGGVSVGTSF
jgi:hypothetical protein